MAQLSPWQNQLNNSITHCLSQLQAIARCYNARYNRSTLVQRRISIDLYQLYPHFTSQALPQFLSHICDREQDKLCISQFDASSVHILQLHIVYAVICFLVVAVPSGEGLTSGFFYWGMLSSVIDRLPYCSALYLTSQTFSFHHSLVSSGDCCAVC